MNSSADIQVISEKIEAKVNAKSMKELKMLLTICDQDVGGKKDELAERFLNFLVEPKNSGKKSLEAKATEKREKAARKRAQLVSSICR